MKWSDAQRLVVADDLGGGLGFKCATLKAQVRIILLRCERKQSLSGDPLQIDLSLICLSGLLFELSSTPGFRVEVANTRHRRCRPYKRCSERKQSLSGDPLQNDLSLICSSGLLSNSVLTPAGKPPLGEWGILLGSVNGTGTYFGDQSPNLLGNCPNL